MRRRLAPQSVATWFLAIACGFVLISTVLAMSGSLRAFAVRSLLMVTDALPPQDAQGRTTMLLLGVGDRDHDGADLTDAILLVSVDPGTDSIALLSIPRDLYIREAEGASPGRLNSLYWQYKLRSLHARGTATETGASLSAMRSLADEIGRRTGVPIQGVAKIDFSGFEHIIDAAGGIDVDVPERLSDPAYPLEPGVVGLFELDAGPRHMDGKTALMYARSRHSTSDFDRSDRQQQILKALARKLGSARLLTDGAALRSLQEFLQEHFETTLTTRESIGLASMVAAVDPHRIVRMNLNYHTGSDTVEAQPGGFMVGGIDSASSGAVLYPSSLTGDTDDWGQIRTLTSFLFQRRDVYLAASRVSIEPAGTKQLAAYRLGNELRRYGFPVIDAEHVVSPAPDANDFSRIEASGDDDHRSVLFLAELLGIPVRSVDRALNEEPQVIRIVLAKEYRFVPFQTLVETREGR